MESDQVFTINAKVPGVKKEDMATEDDKVSIHAEAKCKNGILTLALPKKAGTAANQLTIP